MYAIIETGGHQYKVKPESVIKIEKLTSENNEIVIDKVLGISKDDGTFILGKPYIMDARVNAEIIETKKDKKILFFHKKPRKYHKKLRGHRQIYTYLRIKEIIGG